jgi:hypothetical protein
MSQLAQADQHTQFANQEVSLPSPIFVTENGLYGLNSEGRCVPYSTEDSNEEAK